MIRLGLNVPNFGPTATPATLRAWVEFAEDRKGILKEGYLADLVVLDGDLEAVPKEAIRELKVRATVCDGRVTYER